MHAIRLPIEIPFVVLAILLALAMGACNGGPTDEEKQKLKGEFGTWQSNWEVNYGPSPHTISGDISGSRMINLPMCGTVIGN